MYKIIRIKSVTRIIRTIVEERFVEKPTKYVIYSLSDLDGTLRYIGSTKGPLYMRINQHITKRKEIKTPLQQWIKSIDYNPIIDILAYAINKREMLEIESYFISINKNLFNHNSVKD